ncbi:TIGR03619 family F420-dependent LLM class oxidoreductase [Streptomyces sp. NPDC093252]|uniref:TIGR03619 family F420-dependent LLM class oxidoreductase n=1 Tax=Streptomyces sp. NPDC093252 TaxID=3154980 RepID=UPI0034485609
MKAGVNVLNYGPGTTPDSLLAWVAGAEELGFHLAMISDHVTLPPEVAAKFPAPFYDPFTTLAWLAGQTRTIGLGTTVTVIPYRHPLHTARVAANLDRLSGGRLVFGAGVGWSRQEFDALGIAFGRRGEITDEYLAAILAHWAQDTVAATGPHARYTDITTGPSPLRRPPVWVGGLGDAALRRTARFGDAWHPFGFGAPEVRERLPRLAAAARHIGRPTPAVTPRIALHLTDRPVTGPRRIAGYGTLGQVRDDLEALSELGVPCVVFDTYLTEYLGLVPPGSGPRHDTALLEAVAGELMDLTPVPPGSAVPPPVPPSP